MFKRKLIIKIGVKCIEMQKKNVFKLKIVDDYYSILQIGKTTNLFQTTFILYI